MIQFLVKRISTAIVQLVVVSVIVFLSLHLMPGDPIYMMLSGDGSSVTQEAYDAMEKELGLDQPLLVQLKTWFFGLLKGDLGNSYSERIPVVKSIATRLPRTLELAFVSLFLSTIIGVPLGVLSARKRGKLPDLAITGVSALGNSIPVYVFGYLLVFIIALKLNLLPSSGYTKLSQNAVEHYRKLLMPAVTLTFGLSATTIRMTRSAMLDAMVAENITPLRAKGLSEKRVQNIHVMRNMLIPVVTVIGLQLGTLIAGTVLCEATFNWPGLATLVRKAITYRDYPLIQGCMLVFSGIFILTNMVVDLLNGFLDPRAR